MTITYWISGDKRLEIVERVDESSTVINAELPFRCQLGLILHIIIRIKSASACQIRVYSGVYGLAHQQYICIRHSGLESNQVSQPAEVSCTWDTIYHED